MADPGRDSERISGILIALNTDRSNDTCKCQKCIDGIQESGEQTCKNCGYVGLFVALACQCYDFTCTGGFNAGPGCPHGHTFCPCCDDGNVDPWKILREVRAAFHLPESAA